MIMRSHTNNCCFGVYKVMTTSMKKFFMRSLKPLLSCDVEDKCQNLQSSDLPLRRSTLETDLTIAHAALIAGFEKEIYDFSKYACICCERLHQRKSVYIVSLSDVFIWDELKAHVLKDQPTVVG